MASNNISFVIDVRDAGSGAFRSVTVAAKNADEAIGRIVETAQRAGNGLRDMAAKSLTLATATQALGTLKGMVSGLAGQYNSFEQSMRQANTMAGKSAGEYKALKGEIAGLSREIPIVREELANGLYQVISNGVPEDNWIDFLRDSAKASVGGVADLGQTVTVTSTIIKNYGMAWSDAGAIQNKIQTTAKNGVTSFEQLAASLPRVTGSASQLGVQLDELMAVFSTTTGVTGNTAEVSTQLAAVLNSLIKPTSEASKAADAMGIRFDAASIKACGGFRNFLVELDAAVSDYAARSGQLSETIYGQLFGSAEALRLLGSLTGEQKDTFARNIDAMSESAGTINSVYEEMASTGDSAMTRLQSRMAGFMDAAGSISSVAAPYLEVAANAGIAAGSIAQLVTFVRSLNVASAAAAVAHGAVTAAVKARTLATTTLRGMLVGTIAYVRGLDLATRTAAVGQAIASAATKTWTTVQTALNVVLSANPIGIVVWAIAALVTAIIVAYKKCETFRRICDQAWEVIKKLAKIVWDSLVKAFEAVSGAVKKAWEWVKRFLGLSDGGSNAQVAAQMYATANAAGELAEETGKVASSGLKAAAAADWQAMSYKQLGDEIERQKTKVAELAGTNSANAKAEANRLRQMEKRYKALGKQFGLSGSGGEFDGSALITNARSVKELANNIQYYETRLAKLNPAERAETERLVKSIEALKTKKEAVEALQKSYAVPSKLDSLSSLDKAIGAKRTEIELAINDASRRRLQLELEELERRKTRMEIILEAKPLKPDQIIPASPGKGMQIDLSKMGVKLPDVKAAVKKINDSGSLKNVLDDSLPKRVQNITKAFDGANVAISSMGGVMRSLSSAVGESAGAWLDWGANLLSTVSQALPALKALAIGNTLGQGSAAGPFGWIQAIAGVAAITAAFMAIPKFANGGIAYGPTVGLFGEYAGARSNPEVVAPLSRLREMIRPAGGEGGDRIPEVITLRARGGDLEAVINTRARYRARTR